MADLCDERAAEPLLSEQRNSLRPSDTGWRPPAPISGASGGCCTRCLENYPCLLFIVGNEFCERFSYYGLRTILLVYLSEELQLNEDVSTSLYHAFVVACYFFPMLGGHIADTYWGKFKTIVVLSGVYCSGSTLMSVTAVPTVLDAVGLWGVCSALLLVAIGTGGIKPCVSAFGGDQYQPHQAAQQATFFSIFYFSINVGSMMSTIVTPIVKERFSYAAAFALPAALLVAATLIFISGSSRYVKVPPTGQSVLARVWNVVVQARKNAHKLSPNANALAPSKLTPAHWTDGARGAPGITGEDVDDVRQLLAVLWLMLPLPPFWTLYDQTGSRWTLQAGRMDLTIFNGTVADRSIEITVLPEQIQVVNAALILLFIPLFEGCVYPVLGWCGVCTRAISRMGTGMVLCGASFIMAALLEILIGLSPDRSVSVLWQLPQYLTPANKSL